MSRNTREHPHRTLLPPDEVARLERYHAARRSYPLGGSGRRVALKAATPMDMLAKYLAVVNEQRVQRREANRRANLQRHRARA